jgi:hypothetical protein
MKALIKRAAKSIGFEIRRIQEIPAPHSSEGLPQDEIVQGPWETHVLQMANQHYRPASLRYHRTKYGDDQRLKHIAYFLDLRGLRVLEPGPYEGHHSILLEKMGVRENIAFESRKENLRKCERIKEKYGLERTKFLSGNIEDFYNGAAQPPFSGTFDLVFCLGVLYHVPDPGKALAWFRSQAKTLFLGTHYPDDSNAPLRYVYGGKSYHAKEYHEGGIGDPISGMSPISVQPTEKDLLRLLRDVGYSRVDVLGRDLQNGGQHITILASES